VVEPGKFYEVCLAVIESSSSYYLHTDLCSEIEMHNSYEKNAFNVVPDIASLAVGWKAEEKMNLIRQISVREFGHDHADTIDIEDAFNVNVPSERFYTFENLKPGIGYIVCFTTIYGEIEDTKRELQSDHCKEVITLPLSFPIKEVAAATAASSSTTAVVVALICCCCFPCRRKKKKKKLDQLCENNENKVNGELNTISEKTTSDHKCIQRYVVDTPPGERSCSENILLSCMDQKQIESTSESSQTMSQTCDCDDQNSENSIYSQIKTNDGICEHGTEILQTQADHNYSMIDKHPAKSEDNKEVVDKGKRPINSNATVRSTHSLSSKYSNRKFEETKRYLKKNASLCIRPEEVKSAI